MTPEQTGRYGWRALGYGRLDDIARVYLLGLAAGSLFLGLLPTLIIPSQRYGDQVY